MHHSREFRIYHVVVLLILVASATLTWAQYFGRTGGTYVGPMGTPYPIQQRHVATTGVVGNYGSLPTSPFPTGSYSSMARHRSFNRTPSTRGGMFVPGDGAGTWMANYAIMRGVTTGFRF